MGIGKWFVGLAAFLMLAACSVEAFAGGPEGRGGPQEGRRGKPRFNQLLYAFDDNDDGELEEDEVPGPAWTRLSKADANEDGAVTRKEFDSYRPVRPS